MMGKVEGGGVHFVSGFARLARRQVMSVGRWYWLVSELAGRWIGV